MIPSEGGLVKRAKVIGACLVAAVLLGPVPVEAQTAGPYIRVPHAAGTVYIPLDPSGRPAFPPAAPATPASPKEPGSPAAPTPEVVPDPVMPGAVTRGGGYFVVPPARDRVDPPGSGFQVVPRP